jgi:hypothetical protein
MSMAASSHQSGEVAASVAAVTDVLDHLTVTTPPGSQRDDGDGRLGAMRERFVRCRARLAETLGPRGWEGAAHRARTMPVEETIVRALAALETA